MQLSNEAVQALILAAVECREKAYCPYSGYPVGASILTDQENIYSGCNIESVSFGATICAERAAAAQMVSNGEREITVLALATADGATPCGICRQFLSEFIPDPGIVSVFCISVDKGEVIEHTFAGLWPSGFRTELTQ